MVDPRIHRFYYHYLPSTNDRQHCRMPIRDLAAAWDATKVIASGMLDGQQEDVWTIQTTIVRTLQSYQMIDYDKNNVNEAPRLILDPEILQEPSYYCPFCHFYSRACQRHPMRYSGSF